MGVDGFFEQEAGEMTGIVKSWKASRKPWR